MKSEKRSSDEVDNTVSTAEASSKHQSNHAAHSSNIYCSAVGVRFRAFPFALETRQKTTSRVLVVAAKPKKKYNESKNKERFVATVCVFVIRTLVRDKVHRHQRNSAAVRIVITASLDVCECVCVRI